MSEYIDIHTHTPHCTATCIKNWRLGIEPTSPNGTLFSAGIHPWDAKTLHPTLTSLLSHLEKADCVAIGEIGLDRACDVDIALQREVFELQLQIAIERNLPVIIHCVRAYNEISETLLRHKIRRALFHGFIGSLETMQQLAANGWCISFGFNCLHSPKTLTALHHIPLDRLFLESDTEPRHIEDMYSITSYTKGVDIEKLKMIINDNFQRFFEL